MLSKLIEQFQKPFPFSRGLKSDIISITKGSLIATLFIFLLKPFGLTNAPFGLLAGFGIVVFCSSLVNVILFNVIIRKLHFNDPWMVWKEVIRTLFFLNVIALSLLLYSIYAFGFTLSIKTLFTFLFYTLFIGIIPVSIRVIQVNNWLLRKNLKEANKLNAFLQKEAINDEEKMLSIHSSVVNEQFESTNLRLLFIEAAQNYVSIYYLKDGSISKQLLRIGIASALEQIGDDYIVRCHRSYGVNLRFVKRIESNSQGFKLLLQNSEMILPVSRTFKKELVSKLSSLTSLKNR